VCRTLFYVREIRHSAHARLDHSRPAATPHSLRRPGAESFCLPAKRPTQAEPGLALEAGQARSAPTRADVRERGQDRGFGLGIRQPASTRAASCRESGSRRKLSPDRRAQKRHGSLVGGLERSMVLIWARGWRQLDRRGRDESSRRKEPSGCLGHRTSFSGTESRSRALTPSSRQGRHLRDEAIHGCYRDRKVLTRPDQRARRFDVHDAIPMTSRFPLPRER
jgi:hypothetical protein